MILISIARKYQENPIDSFEKNPIDTERQFQKTQNPWKPISDFSETYSTL